jgi:hypothetical protein
MEGSTSKAHLRRRRKPSKGMRRWRGLSLPSLPAVLLTKLPRPVDASMGEDQPAKRWVGGTQQPVQWPQRAKATGRVGGYSHGGVGLGLRGLCTRVVETWR